MRMAYSESVVVAGGLAHIPILIGVLKALDARTSQTYLAQKAAEAEAKAKAKAKEDSKE